MKTLLGCSFGLIAFIAQADNQQEEITVYGRQVNLVGEAVSASQGLISQEELRLRPLLRTGEVLETVPGMVATQHSGTGKANQYFLRGFNLDHGTDFATTFDRMPLNMRTHGHGQGYTDLNFVIPELVQQIEYKKGPYFAEVGDFSGAGSAHMYSFSNLEHGLLHAGLGEDQFYRILVMDSVASGSGELLYAVEANRYEGPWRDIDEDLDKLNFVLKHSWKLGDSKLSMMLMGYDNSWNSADQIPRRAVASGLIDELGSLDSSVGGESDRHSLSLNWEAKQWQMTAYAIRYDMNLWSNFTYFLDDPLNGDQFEQVDDRWIYGGNFSHRFDGQLANRAMKNTVGIDIRYDEINNVALYRTRERQRIGVVRSDAVEELSVGLYWQNELRLTDKLRSVFALRYDYYDFEVRSRDGVNTAGIDLTGNSGNANDDLLTGKASLSYTINRHWEVYGAAGQGFHSNDARGTTIKVDPVSGDDISAVDPLVKAKGAELGLRTFWGDRLNASVALWYLDLDSELLFVGDAGNTEPSRESDRQGIEITAYYRFNEIWTLDLEYAYSDAEFSEAEPGDPLLGDEIPGALDTVASVGLSSQFKSGWLGSVRVRHFGKRPLEENGEITSDSSTIVNLRVGYQWQKVKLTMDILNLFDSDDRDIDYFYASQLSGEVAPVEDIHFHVMEPRTVRVYVNYEY